MALVSCLSLADASGCDRTITLTSSPLFHMRYAELHCKTNFSFLEGASHAEELAERAAELEYAALAVTDRNSLAGVVRAHVAAKACGLPLIVGTELVLESGSLVLLAPSLQAYGNLCELITTGRRSEVKGQYHVDLDSIARHGAIEKGASSKGRLGGQGARIGQGAAATAFRSIEPAGDCVYAATGRLFLVRS